MNFLDSVAIDSAAMWPRIAIILSMQVMRVLPRRHVSSSESIENLLYYKDCQHNTKTTPKPLKLLKEVKPTSNVPRQPDCPFPKMCCSMSCGNDCGSPHSYLSRQMESLSIEPFQAMQPPKQHMLKQPPIMKQNRNKKLIQLPNHPPNGSRRQSGFTKDKIKSLISQDDDIRKILKDLVKVTMQKVDLVQMIDSQRNNIVKNTDEYTNSEENQ
ncbi:hypothetical protein ACJJTC_012572 [Scirpophaga incertulas]